jgi:hypothetical protein
MRAILKITISIGNCRFYLIGLAFDALNVAFD